MSSTCMIRAITPLLPWRPAILSPSEIFRFWAMLTRTCLLTPAGSSAPASRSKTRTSTTLPRSPCGTRSEVSFTSRAFSPKIARSRRSSAVSSVSPFGVILPTRMSPALTSAPIRMIPFSSRSRRLSSPTFGMSRVISSGPSFVSRASTSCFSMWIEVNLSSRTIDSREQDRVLEVAALPAHERHQDVLAERQLALLRGRASPPAAGRGPPARRASRSAAGSCRCPGWSARTSAAGSVWRSPSASRTTTSRAATDSTTPSVRDMTTWPESRAVRTSMPVPTSGASGFEQRHRLALHVAAHQRAVGVVVLQERDQRAGHAHRLLRRDVDEVDALRRLLQEQRAVPHRDAGVRERVVRVQVDVRLGDREALLLVGRQERDLVRHERHDVDELQVRHGRDLLGDLLVDQRRPSSPPTCRCRSRRPRAASGRSAAPRRSRPSAAPDGTASR